MNVTSYDMGARFSRLEAKRGCMWRTSGRFGLAKDTWCWGPVYGFAGQIPLFFRTGRGSEWAALGEDLWDVGAGNESVELECEC